METHPGLTFLKDAPEFHSRYITTVGWLLWGPMIPALPLWFVTVSISESLGCFCFFKGVFNIIGNKLCEELLPNAKWIFLCVQEVIQKVNNDSLVLSKSMKTTSLAFNPRERKQDVLIWSLRTANLTLILLGCGDMEGCMLEDFCHLDLKNLWLFHGTKYPLHSGVSLPVSCSLLLPESLSSLSESLRFHDYCLLLGFVL